MNAPAEKPDVTPLVGLSIAAVERLLIERTLEQCGGSMLRSAAMLGVCVKTLYNKMHSYEGR